MQSKINIYNMYLIMNFYNYIGYYKYAKKNYV